MHEYRLRALSDADLLKRRDAAQKRVDDLTGEIDRRAGMTCCWCGRTIVQGMARVIARDAVWHPDCWDGCLRAEGVMT
ncbi:hypothetical protein ACFRFH_11980 [Leifsonia sp. NPDC056824]|uniref:hypothetical protein n=1 Tax=Leifsonia sp. NPDC056824 TaxID=3345953 RepID=UPI0036917A3E